MKSLVLCVLVERFFWSRLNPAKQKYNIEIRFHIFKHQIFKFSNI